VKAPETEAAILAFLRAGDLLYREERYEHSYPHCWRTGHPLLYYADGLVVHPHVQPARPVAGQQRPGQLGARHHQGGPHGRLAPQRQGLGVQPHRFWGTPLPVWTCAQCKAQTCIGTKAELKAAGIDAPDVHRPYVDAQ